MQRGTTIAARFELDELLGSGGMGEVYSARDTQNGERVALKLLTAEGPLAAARFQREGALLSRLAHPGVVRFIAAGTSDDDRRYLAMEWLDGEDLAARLDRGPFPIRDAVALIADVGRALAFLHAQNIVHRDVKPSNVFLVGGALQRSKLLDFGIARPMPSSDRLTKTGAGVGTIGYMAPEQVRGDGALDARCDVFALGCVLFECLTGRPPFEGEHALAILTRIVLEPAPAPSEHCPAIPQALDELVGRMLARDREGRPKDAAEVVAALAALDGLPEAEPVAAVETTSVQALAASQRRMVMAILGEDAPDGETLSPEEVEQLQQGLERLAVGAVGALPVTDAAATVDGVVSTRPFTRRSRWPLVIGLAMGSGALAAVLWSTFVTRGAAIDTPDHGAAPFVAEGRPAGPTGVSAVPAAPATRLDAAVSPPVPASAPAPAASTAASTSAAAASPTTPASAAAPAASGRPPAAQHLPAAPPPRPTSTPCSGLDCF